MPQYGSNQKQFQEMFRRFLEIAIEVLELKSLPEFHFEAFLEHPQQPTFGMYVNGENKLYVGLSGRHPNDIFRTIAHELTHYKQDTMHELDDGSGETGSPHENEANSMAGIIMRIFNKTYPEYLRSKPVMEKWSAKYKSSINCANPKGFSQRAHCQGRRKTEAQYSGNLGAEEIYKLFSKYPHLVPEYKKIKKEEGAVKALYWAIEKMGIKLDPVLERKKKRRKKRRAAYGPGPYGWYGYFPGYSNDGETDSGGGDVGGIEEDMSANMPEGKKLVIFDIDDTLVHTQTKVHVVKDGEVVNSLNSHDFTHYKLKPGESFDFEDFRNAKEFFDNHKPIIPMMDQLKRDIATGNKVVMVTARADFDDKELFLDTFRKYGVDMDRVHVYRAGNLKGGSTEERKKQIIKSLLDKDQYTKAIMYDDAKPNLNSFMELKKEYPSTRFYAWNVSLDGEASEYMREEVDENFADGRRPQDKGDSARHGIRKGMTIAQLKKIRSSDSSSPRKKQLAHWQINMRQGRNKSK